MVANSNTTSVQSFLEAKEGRIIPDFMSNINLFVVTNAEKCSV